MLCPPIHFIWCDNEGFHVLSHAWLFVLYVGALIYSCQKKVLPTWDVNVAWAFSLKPLEDSCHVPSSQKNIIVLCEIGNFGGKSIVLWMSNLYALHNLYNFPIWEPQIYFLVNLGSIMDLEFSYVSQKFQKNSKLFWQLHEQ